MTEEDRACLDYEHKYQKEIARLKTDNEGLKDCLLARDCAIKEYKEENEELRKGKQETEIDIVQTNWHNVPKNKQAIKINELQVRISAMEKRAGDIPTLAKVALAETNRDYCRACEPCDEPPCQRIKDFVAYISKTILGGSGEEGEK